MRNFVCIIECMRCGVQTDRNGVCVACEAKIRPYRVLDAGKMRLVLSDGDRFRYIADVSCQRCGSSVVDDTFDEEGTCWNCVVHNMVRPHVMGQWYFIVYQVTMAPCRSPVKNVVKEMSSDMAKKFEMKGGVGYWTEDPTPSAKPMGKVLDEIKSKAGIMTSDMKIHSYKEGIDRNLGAMICLFCGHRVWQVDKDCPACDTDNDIVIRFLDGEKWIVHRSVHRSTGQVKFKEIKELACPWCKEASELSDALECSLCGIYVDVIQEHYDSLQKQPDGRMRSEVLHFAFLCPHRKSGEDTNERPENAVEIIGRPVPPPRFSSSPSSKCSTPPNSQSVSPASSTPVVSPPPQVNQQSTAIVLRKEQSPVVASDASETEGKNLTERIFGRNAQKQPSARTVRRHSKAARDAETLQLERAARRLVDQGYSERKIASVLSEQFGKKIGKSKVRRLLNKD